MIVALDKQGTSHIARDAEKTHPNGDKQLYVCPQCKETVVLKKGMQVIHHYAHKPEHNCAYGSGESEHHYNIKMSIYDALSQHDQVESCYIEKSFHEFGVRPDVFIKLKENPDKINYVAIEIQKSNIDIETIVQRTRRYAIMNTPMIWVMTNLTDFYNPQPGEYLSSCSQSAMGSPNKKDEWIKYRTKDWELFLHAYYYGRMYYWKDNANVTALHFKKTYTKTGSTYSKKLRAIQFLTDKFIQDRKPLEKHLGSKYYSYSECGIDFQECVLAQLENIPDAFPKTNLYLDSFRAIRVLNLVDDFKSYYRTQWNHEEYEYKNDLGETNIPKTYLWIDKNKPWY